MTSTQPALPVCRETVRTRIKHHSWLVDDCGVSLLTEEQRTAGMCDMHLTAKRRTVKSWNHTVRRLTPAEAAWERDFGRVCARPRCSDPRAVTTTYDYVMGAGRLATTAERLLCEAHARKFAADHNLTLAE